MCAVCMAIYGEVPSPEGLIRLSVHPEVLSSWKVKLPEGFPSIEFTRHYAGAFPLMLAWMLETTNLDRAALRNRVVQFQRAPKSEDWVNLMMRKPTWLSWQKSEPLDTGFYADSDEDRHLTEVFRQVLGNDEWSRTAWTQYGPFWDDVHGLTRWIGNTPEGHPAKAKGMGFTTVLPWGGIMAHDNITIMPCIIEKASHEAAAAEAVRALVRSRCFSPETPIWKAVGLA